MIYPGIPVWKEAPCLRLVLPLMAGIAASYYLTIPTPFVLSVLVICGLVITLLLLAPLCVQFRWHLLHGILLNTAVLAAGCLLSNSHNGLADAKSALAFCRDSATIMVSIQEPLSEKSRTWKGLASLDLIRDGHGRYLSPPLKLFLYFRKDSLMRLPVYGDRLVFKKFLKPIENTAFTGSFDYQQYCRLKNIHFQVFLAPEDFSILPEKNKHVFRQLIFEIRIRVIQILKRYIPGTRECGLAEALLIGFRDDLDRELMQSYSNTGVVHVVAISGLHLGLIYGILSGLCLPFGKKRIGRVATLLITLGGLWMFSLLAGGSPSIIRSAVMFSFIATGNILARRASVVNSLAASAIILLWYDPFWLWDLGFQLSYAALLSIVIFMKPIYTCLVFTHRISETFWKLNAVTIAAQILTIPLTVYYFHQFPNLFLITNILAVPLSSLILIGEIVLCAISWLPLLASPVGWLLSGAIRLMNTAVQWFDSFSFSVWRELDISGFQLLLLYAAITALAAWLLRHCRPGLPAALICTILFLLFRFHK